MHQKMALVFCAVLFSGLQIGFANDLPGPNTAEVTVADITGDWEAKRDLPWQAIDDQDVGTTFRATKFWKSSTLL